MNGVEPFAYLTGTIEAIATYHPHADIDDLLPWAVPKAAVEAVAKAANERPLGTGYGNEPLLTTEFATSITILTNWFGVAEQPVRTIATDGTHWTGAIPPVEERSPVLCQQHLQRKPEAAARPSDRDYQRSKHRKAGMRLATSHPIKMMRETWFRTLPAEVGITIDG